MKSALVMYSERLNIEFIKDVHKRLHYDRLYVLYGKTKLEEKDLKVFKNIHFILTPQRRSIEKNIQDIFENLPKNMMLLPYFKGDSRSKYAVSVYNKMFGTKINPKIFKEKNLMNNFLEGAVGNKRNVRFSYDEVCSLSYEQLTEKVGEHFILKPTNAASSVLSFKITSQKDLDKACIQLKKKYDYICEEYLEGSLYSVDFYCNGDDVFLLCLAREIPFAEMLEKLSPAYLEKYSSLYEEFLHFLPLTYGLGLEKLSRLEIDFIKEISKKLLEKKYKGLIHLEYKVQKKEKKIGFIEWGARSGGRRYEFIKGMYGLRMENIPHKLLFEKDTSGFREKDGMYFLKNRDHDKNYVFIKTNVIQKTHIMTILKKIPSFLTQSFEQFVKEFLWDNWKVRTRPFLFQVRTNKDHCLFPFYQRSDTGFTYMLEMDEESFERFKKKKTKILERLVFHDYHSAVNK